MSILEEIVKQEIKNNKTKLIEIDIYRKPYELIKTIKLHVNLIKNWVINVESIIHNIYSLCPYISDENVVEQIKTERFFFTETDDGCAIDIILREPLSVVITREFLELLDWSSQSTKMASLLASFLTKEDLIDFYNQLSCIINNKLITEKYKYIEECE